MFNTNNECCFLTHVLTEAYNVKQKKCCKLFNSVTFRELQEKSALLKIEVQ